MRLPIRLFCLSAVAALLLTSCSDSSGDDEASPSTMSTATTQAGRPNPVGPPPDIQIEEVASLDRPTALAQRSGDNSLFVAEKGGVIRTIENGNVDATPVLDISDEVSDDGERGLLGLAFAPDSSVFYINYTNNGGDTRVVEYELDNGGRADPRSRREILAVDQPNSNHNGGDLAFGPDGSLFIALGDGGGAGDPDDNAQDLSSLLGKILRIDPANPSDDLPYTVPYDNPFVEQGGARGEIFAYGLRNPWRFSFDTAGETEGMWIADVGQNKREEINYVEFTGAGGQNFGWPLREGTIAYEGGEKPTDAIDPVYDYERAGGPCSITGGHVYRGDDIPDLTGRYIYADFCTGDLSSLTLRGTTWESDQLSANVASIAAFGRDSEGEIYTLSQNGQVGRIVPAD
jgi:glucose/arabinose dehydrogenase